MAYRFMSEHRGEYAIREMAGVLGVSCGAYYQRAKRVSRKKAARLMRENGLSARGRWKFIPTTRSNHGLPVCENILSREFQADRAGEKAD